MTGAEDPSLQACAWAFTVWLECSGEMYFYGQSSHTTVLQASPFYLGETDSTPLTAEQLALCWALVWVLDVAVPWHLPVLVCYDCTSAGYGAFGIFSPPPGSAKGGSLSAQVTRDGFHTLSEAAAVLRQCGEESVGLTHRHVPGHSGVLANELTDQFAKAAARNRESEDCRCLPMWPRRLLAHPLCDWAWCSSRGSADLPFLPAFEAEAGRLQSGVRVAPAPPSDGAVTLPAAQVTVKLGFATFNVLTLLDPQGVGT